MQQHVPVLRLAPPMTGTVTLAGIGGSIAVPTDILCSISPILSDLLRCTSGMEAIDTTLMHRHHSGHKELQQIAEGRCHSQPSVWIQVEDDVEAWQDLLRLIRPSDHEPNAYCIHGSITWDNAETIYQLADKYDMQQICKLCSQSLCMMAASPSAGLSESSWSPSYVLHWLNMAERFQLHNLYGICMEFAVENMCCIDGLQPCLSSSGTQPASPFTPQTSNSNNVDSSSSSSSSSSTTAVPANNHSEAGHGHGHGQAGHRFHGSDAYELDGLSKGTSLQLLQSAVAQLHDYKELWEGVTAALQAEGLAYDLVQGEVRIRNFDRWRRLAPPVGCTPIPVRRSCSTSSHSLPGQGHRAP